MVKRKFPGSKPTGSGRTPVDARRTAGKLGSGKITASAARRDGMASSSVPLGKKSGTSATKTGNASSTKSARPASRGPAQKRPKRKQKSIVNQKQTPWGLIISALVVVAFATGVVGVVIATHRSSSSKTDHTTAGGQSVKDSDPYRQPELPAAAAIRGVTYKIEAQHTHVIGTIKYDSSPPVGGDHNQYWANCNGNVYNHQIANENAVHMLEHGAIWITYNPRTLPSSQLSVLTKYVAGVDRTALSPYAGLKTPISLQAWGYQLFVTSASDPRIAQFIKVLKDNPKTTPENASCTDPYFDANKSTLGHPQETAT